MKPNIQDYREAIRLGSTNTTANSPETEQHLYAISGVVHICDWQGWIVESHNLLTMIEVYKNRQLYGWSDDTLKDVYLAGRRNAIHNGPAFSEVNEWFKYFIDDMNTSQKVLQDIKHNIIQGSLTGTDEL